MKKMNFISSIPPHEQQAIVRWYRLSILFFSLIILCIITVHAYQFYRLSVLKKNSAELNTSTHTYDSIIDMHQKLTKDNEKLTHYNQQAACSGACLDYPIQCLTFLQEKLSADSTLASLNMNDRTLNATVHCSTASIGADLTKTFAQAPYMSNIKLASLQSGKLGNRKTIIVSLHGTMSSIS